MRFFSACVRALPTALLTLPLVAALHGQTNLKYQEPPKAIIDLVDTHPTPVVEVSPKDKSGKQWLLIETISGLPPITDLAQPELRLAGLRMNPRTNGPSRGRYFTSLRLEALPDGAEKTVTGVPNDPHIRFTGWSPDARHVYFVNASDDPSNAGLSLWIVEVATAQAKQISGVALNGIFGAPCEWMSDGQSLVCKVVVKSRGSPPQLREVPAGPVVQENLGRATPGATYEDMIRNPEDEASFDYYATSQVEIVGLDGRRTQVLNGIATLRYSLLRGHDRIVHSLHGFFGFGTLRQNIASRLELKQDRMKAL